MESNMCPFVGKHYEECYCTNLNSQDIIMAIYFCNKNFKYCEIHKKLNGLDVKEVDSLTASVDDFYGAIEDEVKRRETFLSGI